MVRIPVLGALLVASLCLAGCAAPAAEGEHDAAPAGEHAAASEGEGDHGAAEPAAMPEDFPVDDVPLVDRELHTASVSGSIWTIAFTSDDTTADLAEASAMLTGAGFENTLSDPLYGDFATASYKVRVYVIPDEHTITYLVTPTAVPTEEAPAEEESSH